MSYIHILLGLKTIFINPNAMKNILNLAQWQLLEILRDAQDEVFLMGWSCPDNNTPLDTEGVLT
ncbi:hypothetical protein Lmor_0372 [Legionella moravica]|uniref:Uncharacterized protein n=1 Tax=Legionella moravica TaxID=39962 RepID=A0A378K168_9GAMM|nr:hypothetical protein Lmor_0372 [Legionella moravica]STX61571.1 Uncharacterised protein [Legionella moravica]